MALWLMRCGRHGEFETRFLADKRIYLTWDKLPGDIRGVRDRGEVRAMLERAYTDRRVGKLSNHSGQIWAFVRRMKAGDWVVVPSKMKPAVHVAEITGDCDYDESQEHWLRHSREVKWIATDVPRSNFGQDLLFSFGAIMTICEIHRNDAEARVRAMAKHEWRDTGTSIIGTVTKRKGAAESEGGAGSDAGEDDDDAGAEDSVPRDLEEVARDQIARLIIARFKGHGLAHLVDAIFQAQGYSTYRSPPGADKGVDILAAHGHLGFAEPRICIQVKSGDSPLDRPTLDQLVGTMRNFRAEHGLLVSWGGFKSSIDKETAAQFFSVRLWDRDDLIRQLLEQYERLDDEIRAELPLKRIWTVSVADEDGGDE